MCVYVCMTEEKEGSEGHVCMMEEKEGSEGGKE